MTKYQKYIVWPLKPKITLRFNIILVTTVLFLMVRSALKGECIEEVLELSPSPDGRWTAILDQDACDVAIGMSILMMALSVSPRDAPDREIVLLTLDPGDYDKKQPLRWTGQNRLQVTLRSRESLHVANAQFGDAHVEVIVPTGKDAQPASRPNIVSPNL